MKTTKEKRHDLARKTITVTLSLGILFSILGFSVYPQNANLAFSGIILISVAVISSVALNTN